LNCKVTTAESALHNATEKVVKILNQEKQ